MKDNKQLSQRSGRAQQKHVTKSAAPPQAIDEQQFRWSAAEVDHEYQGAWHWGLTPKDIADLLALLEHMSSLTWREVKALRANSRRNSRPLHHDQLVSSICAAAQQRLVELQIDVETVFRLRHGNMIRIWGYLMGPVFRILWYDRDHKVCPSENG